MRISKELVYNLIVVIALGLVTAGMWMISGAAIAMVVLGAAMLVLTMFAAAVLR